MAYERFPYTDFHDLNLDWVIAKIKQLSDKVDNDIEMAIREVLADMFVRIVYDAETETIMFDVTLG
jgi:hypothetical protein